MVFNRHLKALNLCNHSDTIACVLYELLVCLELFNVIFHHDQGSTSFSFVQFSRSCCAAASPWQLVYYISDKLICQGLFWKFFEEVFFKKRIQAVGISFSGCRREMTLRDSLIIIASGMTLVNTYFWFFRQILILLFGQDVYGGINSFGVLGVGANSVRPQEDCNIHRVARAEQSPAPTGLG